MRTLSCGERAILNQDDDDSAPYVVAFRTGTATARKHHKCAGCPNGHVAPGDRYSFFIGTVDGEFMIDRMCLPGAKTPDCDDGFSRPSKPAPEPVYGPEEMPF